MSKSKPDTRPLGSQKSWAQTPGTYIAGQASIDGVDHAAVMAEQKWGAGRLRLLVSTKLREKFDRQRYLWNQAIWHGDLEAVRRESVRMIAAWQALDKAAEQSNCRLLSPRVWEVVLADGTVAAITNDAGYQTAVVSDGRQMAIYSLNEIGRILSHYAKISQAKIFLPGITVEAVRHPSDPLDAIRDSAGGLDDPLEEPISTLGL